MKLYLCQEKREVVKTELPEYVNMTNEAKKKFPLPRDLLYSVVENHTGSGERWKAQGITSMPTSRLQFNYVSQPNITLFTYEASTAIW